MRSGSRDIIFLLGAGASAEADIPVSAQMISYVEESFSSEAEKGLYHHVKSAILFAAGLKGHFGATVPFNIETLVNTLYELERNEDHPLYPFIAAWNSRFETLAGAKFQKVKEFRRRILADLKGWMCPDDGSKANYYQGLVTLQQDLTYPLHVFSLNYDLCVENLNGQNFRVETGFGGYGPDYPWDWQRFETETNNNSAELFLYKLHGSINWKRNSEKQLFSVAQIQNVDADKMEIIFGREFKLEAADPYLFFAYALRNLSLETKLMVAIGYGFGDPHINKMLTQSLRANSARRLYVVRRCAEEDRGYVADQILKLLELNATHLDQIIVTRGSAKEFLKTPDLAKSLIEAIPKDEDVPF